MTANHAWMLKGWLLGANAPVAIVEAVEKVIESLTAVPRLAPANVQGIDLPQTECGEPDEDQPEPEPAEPEPKPEKKRRRPLV